MNGMPIINNREYNGTITVKDGESSVVTGLLSRDDSLSLMGYPFLARVPGFTYAASEHDKNVIGRRIAGGHYPARNAAA